MYVDDTETSRVQIKDSTKLPLTGGDLTGPLGLGGNVISNVGAPLAVAALTACKYLLNKVEELENKLTT